MRRLIAAAAVAAAVVSGGVAAPAQAAPWCYYNYGGCYLDPGWYPGGYWGGGPWYSWSRLSMTDRIMDSVNGCPVAWVDGRCPVR